MSKKNKRALTTFAKAIRANTPKIEGKLAKAGSKPDHALVFSAAKYYKALKRLAEA